MAHISRRKALRALNRNLELGRAILSNPERTDRITRWGRDTDELMREVLSDNSELYKTFHKVSFVSSMQMVEDGVLLLQESIGQILEYGLISERTQVSPLVYTVVIPLFLIIAGAVASLFSPPVQRWLGFDPNGYGRMTEAEREVRCKELAVLFKNRLSEFDMEFRAGRDSLVHLRSPKVASNPRIASRPRANEPFRELVEYRSRATTRRNNIIDSFFVAFEAAGCDTTGPLFKKVSLK